MPTDKPKPADLATIQATIDDAFGTETRPLLADWAVRMAQEAYVVVRKARRRRDANDPAWTMAPILEWRDGRYQPVRRAT